MNKFDQFDFQVILYSKGWYKETDPISDISKILSKISMSPIEHIKPKEVLYQVSKTCHQVMSYGGGMNSSDMRILYLELWEGILFEPLKSITMNDHIAALLRVIRYKKDTCYPSLPGPSEEFLPFARVDSLEHWHAMTDKGPTTV